MSIIDKTIRIILGFTILIYFGLFYPTWWSFLGLIPLITGVIEFCPIYKIFKKQTKKENKAKSKNKKKKFFKFKKRSNQDNTQKDLFKN